MVLEKKKNDFDAEIITQTTEQHGKDISGITDRLTELENKFKPEFLADILDSASKDSKKIDKLFSRLFCEMMKKDEDVKIAISNHIKSSDRSIVYSTLKKWGWLILGAIVYVLGLLTTAFINHFVH